MLNWQPPDHCDRKPDRHPVCGARARHHDDQRGAGRDPGSFRYAYITGRQEFLIDPDDPLARGFMLR